MVLFEVFLFFVCEQCACCHIFYHGHSLRL